MEADRERPLLARLTWEERLALWESLPEGARKELVEELARLLLRVADSEVRHEAGESDPGTAS